MSSAEIIAGIIAFAGEFDELVLVLVSVAVVVRLSDLVVSWFSGWRRERL